jgi:tetratricopeptide (TPR) repeat protein
MKRSFLYSFCFLLILSGGCKKFLDVRPDTTSVNPTTINDFEEILNSDSLALCDFFLADLVSDDVRMTDITLSQDTTSFYSRAYLWGANIWNPGDEDVTYNSTYSRILQMNIILAKIDASNGSDQRKNIVRAQAQINRAWYYLQLVNLYGLDYQSATASNDLAVPLILLPNANQLPARTTVQRVYDQILQDLTAAAASVGLPSMGQTIVQPGKASAYGLLAKTYLYMGNYPQALNAADTALSIKNTLLDYNSNYLMPASLIDLSKNPEVLLGKLCIDHGFTNKYFNGICIGTTLRALLDSNDTRLLNNFNNDTLYNINVTLSYQQVFNYSVTVPEVLLIKAECLARQGDAAGAISLLNQLRQNRLVQYTPLDNNIDALTAVLEERRRELFYHGGSRLFDLKRLNRAGVFTQALQRIADDHTSVLATLPLNSPRYLMQFSPIIVANNPQIIQNPR